MLQYNKCSACAILLYKLITEKGHLSLQVLDITIVYVGKDNGAYLEAGLQ